MGGQKGPKYISFDTGCQVTILATSVFEQMFVADPRFQRRIHPCGRWLVSVDSSLLVVRGELCISAHAFDYRIAVLQSGIKQAARTARSKKAERCFLDGISLPWGKQVAVMFQIVCTLTLAVPALAEGVTDILGVSPDVLLSSEPWGHADHNGITCRRRYTSNTTMVEWTGAYVHAVAAAHGDPANPRPSLPCACIIPAAECPPALLRDTADCSPADVAPMTYLDLANLSPADFARATLRNSADPSPARPFKRQCLTGSVLIHVELVSLNCLVQIVISTWGVEYLFGSTLITASLIKPRGIDYSRPSN